MAMLRVRNLCLKCKRIASLCTCEDVCQRCLLPSNKCTCEESRRPGRYDHQDERFQPDEERDDDFRRDYLPDHEHSTVYWHGWNFVRKFGKRAKIICPYQGAARREFFEGVSDARWSLT